ncbi:hypothetical protein MLD38_012293 [Melastoma candidum]|uniref:Uncharacterized protein n=1 Tax=Melastoma candidum TaxID=119954 RepID=A0ACB9R761_9MYRT|nr:hypothetical protein MLD38_012293 [Melastoma candidum]
MGSPSAPGNGNHDMSFKVLLIGDSGVGKSSLLLSFTSADPVTQLPPTIGVDFKIKHVTVRGKRIKLTIWDTAGQERFRTLTSSYYRNSQGIILVYDVTRRETFVNISDLWAKEVELYSTNLDCVKMLVGNKVDEESRRSVTKDEGAALAEAFGCLFMECSARTRENVEECFEGLISKIIESPSLVKEGSSAINKGNILEQSQGQISAHPPPRPPPPPPPFPSSPGCCF